jgi:Ca2+-binding EF-hand superfamily protein
MRNLKRKRALPALLLVGITLPATYAAAAGSANSGSASAQSSHTDPMIQKMDENGDGKISKKEFDDTMNKRFDALDTNHDGYIEESELQAARKRLQKRLQKARKQMQQRQQQMQQKNQ